MKIRLLLLFTLIFSMGIVLRLHNLSPFKIYPDSYQSLIVAQNIHTYHSVIGYLGQGGLLYPDFFMWTRPGLPILINVFSMLSLSKHFSSDSAMVASLLSLFSGILIIPAAYFFVKSVFKSRLYGISAAVLVALSFNLTIWSGFIMTETTGVLFMMLFLWSLFSSLNRKSKLADPKDLLTGLLFSFAILTRYEYLIISLPLIFLCLYSSSDQVQYCTWESRSHKPHPNPAHASQGGDLHHFVRPVLKGEGNNEKGLHKWNINSFIRLINIFSVALLCISIVGVTLFPIRSVFNVMFNQSKDLLLIAGIIGIIFIFFILLLRFGRNKFFAEQSRSINTLRLTPFAQGVNGLILVAIWSFALLIILQIVFGEKISFLYYDISYIRNFARHDFLISLFSLIGFTILLFERSQTVRGVVENRHSGQLRQSVSEASLSRIYLAISLQVRSWMRSPLLTYQDDAKIYVYSCLFSIVSLAFIYHRINPDMERYMTHLIPFLLLPSSLGLGIVIKRMFPTLSSFWLAKPSLTRVQNHPSTISRINGSWMRSLHSLTRMTLTTQYLLLATLLAAILWQATLTYHGLRYLHDNSWYRISYEEKSAGLVESFDSLRSLRMKNELILIASLPEAYYYDLNIPTQSINDNYPFIYMENVKDNPTLIIIVDMPMREIFPTFTKFVTRKLQKYKTGEYYVHELYHSTNIVEKEKFPVSVYKITLRDLTTVIQDSRFKI